MRWTVSFKSANNFTATSRLFSQAGFNVQLHDDTLNVWETLPVSEYKVVVDHPNAGALTLFMLANGIDLEVLEHD